MDKIRVLYVDDNPHDRALVRDALEQVEGDRGLVREQAQQLIAREQRESLAGIEKAIGDFGMRARDNKLEAHARKLSIGRTITRKVMKDRVALLSQDAKTDAQFGVTQALIGDYAYIPTYWRAKAGGPDEDGVPTMTATGSSTSCKTPSMSPSAWETCATTRPWRPASRAPSR